MTTKQESFPLTEANVRDLFDQGDITRGEATILILAIRGQAGQLGRYLPDGQIGIIWKRAVAARGRRSKPPE